MIHQDDFVAVDGSFLASRLTDSSWTAQKDETLSTDHPWYAGVKDNM